MKRFFICLLLLLFAFTGCQKEKEPSENTVENEKTEIIKVFNAYSFTDTYIYLDLLNDTQYDLALYKYNRSDNNWKRIFGAFGCEAKSNDIIIFKNNHAFSGHTHEKNFIAIVGYNQGRTMAESLDSVFDEDYVAAEYVMNDDIEVKYNEEIILGYLVLRRTEKTIDEFNKNYYLVPDNNELAGDYNILCITLLLKK